MPLFMIVAVSTSAAKTIQSEDAYIKTDNTQWILGTASVEKTVALQAGQFRATALLHKATGRQWVTSSTASEEFFATVNNQRLSGLSGQWKLVRAKTSKLKQGELQLDLTLEREGLRVTKTYVVHPGSSIIREWVTFSNRSQSPMTITEPGFLTMNFHGGHPNALDFHWMTGGENKNGCWQLKTETLPTDKPRLFDSYDQFPGDTPAFPGDGVQAKILLNDQQVWPGSGWQFLKNATVTLPFDVTVPVAKGDRLLFWGNQRERPQADQTAFDPTLTYDDGETHLASKEFSPEQGRNGWRYQYVEKGQYLDLVYYADRHQWRKAQDNAAGTPYVGAFDQHPDQNQDAVRVWTAPKAGRLRISGLISNIGNRENGVGSAGVRMGSSSYIPWSALFNRETKDGLFIGWDYFGHWASSYARLPDGGVQVQFRVAGHKQTLAPGQSLTTPKAFVGFYRDDLDNAGNECLDWQYRYLWDYTRQGWFPAIRMLHYWMKGTGWGQPGVSWTGGNPDLDSTFRKVFRVADLMRYVGADVYHRDWGWWDRAGEWNGPDFRTMGNYLRKHQMGQLIYAFLYTVDLQSKVAREHPDWLIGPLGGQTLDMSRPEVVAFIKGQLDAFVKQWGDFEWRNDSDPLSPRLGDDTPLLGQDQGLRDIIRSFLDKHPGCAFQAVNGGGICAGYDYVRYASTLQFSDGAVGIIRNYWASLLLPPDKSNDQPDISPIEKYDKATWRGSLCCNFDTTGDSWNVAKLEGLRELNDIYRYLYNQGVVGRWVHVYRPKITGDDPTLYFQRLSRDSQRGLIIPKRPAPGPVTIKPKGLLPQGKYLVSFHESAATEERTGTDLMEQGIVLQKMLPGELIYLNLPLHPGSRRDTSPPSAPTRIVKRKAQNMGYPGVEVEWRPGADDNWVSYYEIFRNGVAIDKAAKGTFYFDHSAGADLAALYEVRTVDGAGNVSSKAAARGSKSKPSQIIDDTPGGGITFSPQWQPRKEPALVAYNATITAANQKGATAELVFEGKRILWFTKLGANCGKASVSIDGGPAQVIDTYSADDIWGVGIYQKEFPTVARHTLRLQVLGEHSPRAKDSYIHLDGFRIEME